MNAFNRRSYSGIAPDTTLASGVDNAALTVTVTDATGWPDGTGGPFEVTFEPDTTSEEKNWASGRTGNTITLLGRGMEGAALAHAASTTVRHGLSAKDVDEANYAVSQTVGQVTAKGDVLVGSAANTLTRVAKGSAGQAPTWQADGSVAAANPTPAAHTHAEADVTNLSTDLAGKMANPATAWAKGSLLVGTGAGTYNTEAVGVAGAVLTAQADGSLVWTASPANAPLAHVDYTGTTASFAATLAALNTTSLTASFTVPASGKVLVRVSGLLNRSYSGTSDQGSVGWLNHTGGAQVGRTQVIWSWSNPNASSSDSFSFSRAQTITGLTAGATEQLDLAGVHSGSGSTTLTDITIEVWALS